MHDLIIFSNVDEHPLAGLLKPGFRHVTAVRYEDSGYWVQHDWAPSGIKLSSVGGSIEQITEFYAEHGGTVFHRPVHMRFWEGQLLMLNNCVGHTKALLGIPSWAVTPYQLYRYLIKEHAHDPMHTAGRRDLLFPETSAPAAAAPAASESKGAA